MNYCYHYVNERHNTTRDDVDTTLHDITAIIISPRPSELEFASPGQLFGIVPFHNYVTFLYFFVHLCVTSFHSDQFCNERRTIGKPNPQPILIEDELSFPPFMHLRD